MQCLYLYLYCSIICALMSKLSSVWREGTILIFDNNELLSDRRPQPSTSDRQSFNVLSIWPDTIRSAQAKK